MTALRGPRVGSQGFEELHAAAGEQVKPLL
jgi:hypothetical protein